MHAAPVPAPGPAEWPAITRERDEYRRVSLSGTFLNGQETLVQAATRLGAGFWVLTPLRTEAGPVVLVNRGFVPSDRRDHEGRTVGDVTGPARIVGLLRISEPKGGFLRENEPETGRWFSRDVEAIARARGLSDVAPYFVDADETPNPGGLPIGGLTVIAFPDNHLVYALTWYALALMVFGASCYMARHEWRVRRARRQAG